MPRHRAAPPRSHPLVWLGTAVGALAGTAAVTPTAAAAAVGVSGCDRHVHPDDLDSAIKHAKPGQVLCLRGDHGKHHDEVSTVKHRHSADLHRFSLADLLG